MVWVGWIVAALLGVLLGITLAFARASARRRRGELAELRGKIEELDRDRSRLEAMLEAMPDPVVAVNGNFGVDFANGPARDLFPDVGCAPAGSSREVDRLGEEVSALVRRAVSDRRSAAGTVTMGAQRTYQATVNPLIDAERVQGAVAVFHDQTALRRLERIRSDFVANVSHELRTPLTAIHGFIETLQDGSYKDASRTLRYLGIMHAETTRLTALINDLLHLSKLESPDSVLSLEPVDMARLAGEVVELFRRPAEAKALRLELSAAGDLSTVMADAALIRQALLNLVDNAIKYTEPDGSVCVTVERDGSGVRLAVKDTGVGIPADSLDRIFERFYRVDKARSRKEGGTGLGLSIVKHTVESHHGKLGVDSKLGRGTTIWFSLPAAPK